MDIHKKNIFNSLIIIGVLLWMSLTSTIIILTNIQSTNLSEMYAYSFIIPILVCSFLYGRSGGLFIAILSSIISGLILLNDPNVLYSELSRRIMFQIIFFNIIALVTCGLTERLKEAQNRYISLFEQVPIGLYRIALNGFLLEVNSSFRKIFGFSIEEDLSKVNASDLFGLRDDFIKWKSMVDQKKDIHNYETNLKKKDNTNIIAENSTKVIIDDEGRPLYYQGALKDITIRKKAEKKIKEAHDQLEKKVKERTIELEKANRLLQDLDLKKDKFISLAAHELKTPLSSIKGFSQLLQNPKILEDIEKRKHFLNLIQENSDRLYDLVIDLIDSTKISLGKIKINIETIECETICNDIKENMIVVLNEQGINHEFSCEKNMKVRADLRRVHQILRNLVSNSIKFTKEGGLISFKIYKREPFIQFEISDTGIGIPKDKQDSIFERFYQVDDPYKKNIEGSGLGLSICKGLVELMKGKIWFKSTEEKGSIFYFTLPIA